MFTEEELEMLNDALDALQAKSGQDMIFGSLLGAMFSKDKEESTKYMEEEKAKYESKEQERRQLKNRIILLKAKLIRMADASTAQEAADILRGG